jgi:tetratricopeptide (TPR) repeat protein
MQKIGRGIGAGISLFLFSAMALAVAQNTNPTGDSQAPAQVQAGPADHSRAYYHFMLARRYRELAGVYNRSDYVDRAISEYKQAIEADPDSLFLRVELAELYWRTSRIGDAIKEAEGVLKTDPNYPDAHRLLARVYWHMLGENQPDKNASKESLGKAIEHLEALTRLNPSDSDSWLVLGRLYKMSNQGAKAEAAFRKVLNSDPNSKAGIANLAQLYFEQGDYQPAIDLLKKIPDSDMDPAMLGMLAYAYSQTRDYDNAVTSYEKALAQDPENQDLRRAFADALIGAGKSAEARNELQKVLKADPEDGAAYLRLAQLDRQEGRFEQARQELERAKTLLPDNLEIPLRQAELEDTLGNDDKAIQILQGLVTGSEHSDGQYTVAEANNRAIFLERLGTIYRSQEKFDQAMDAFKQIIALGKTQAPRGEQLIIETLRLRGQTAKALEEANAAVKQYPNERSLRVIHDSLLGEQGHVEEAVKDLQALLNNTPADREVYLATAQIYVQSRHFSEAEGVIQKALALSPKPEDQEYALFMLGSVYEREKRFDLAEEQFKRVLSADPLNASAANYLGYMLADRGIRLDESVKYIQKALQLDPNNGAYLDSLGWAYYKMDRYDLAESHLEKAAHLIQNDPTIHEHLGHLYLRMGKKAQAEEEWERALKEWPHASSSDFDADQAAKLQKQLDDLKVTLAKEKAHSRN